MQRWQRYAALGSALVVGACGGSGPHEVTNAFQWSEQLPPGATLHVRDLNGNIRVEPAAGQAVQVIGSKVWHRGRERDVQFVANHVGNDVYICALWGTRSRCDATGYTASGHSFSIWRLFSLRRGGDIRADIAVSLPAGVKLDVFAINGGATIDGLSSDVRARVVNGTIRVHNAAGALSAETVNGSVVAAVDSLTSDGPFVFKSVNGSVHVTLPAALQGDISLETVTGRAASDFPLSAFGGPTGRMIRGTIGTGSRHVSLKTVNGTVELKKG